MTSFTQKILLAAILFCSINLVYAATLTVTNSNDNGAGSLRQTVAEANSGDTIVFASDVNYITLTSGRIEINKNLTIDGGSDTANKVMLDGGHFFSRNHFTHYVNFTNLIFTNSNTTTSESAITIANNSSRMLNVIITATNCDFIKNYAYMGGAVCMYWGKFIAINCKFIENVAKGGFGGAIDVTGSESRFIAINCIFYKNTTDRSGGSLSVSYGGTAHLYHCTFTQNFANQSGGAIANRFSTCIIVNSTFNENSTNGGGGAIVNTPVIYLGPDTVYANTFLYHCTFDRNQALNGGGIHNANNNNLYSYNCLFTENTPNQIHDNVTAGNNMIEGVNGVTRDLVFGTNEYTNGYIIPLEFAKTATRLTANNIQVPTGISAYSINSWLAKDQRGKDRPFTGFRTYGAVEYDESSINEMIRLNTVNIFPNPASNYFTVSFELEKANNMRIALLDLSGRELLHIYDGFTVEGNFTTTVDTEHLASGVYFLQILIDGNIGVAKVIVE